MSYTNLLDIIYPVGSFYFSTNYDSPSQIIGGNWEQIDGAAIRATSIDESSSINYIGDDACTLTASQMPKHQHVATWQCRLGNVPTGSGYTVPICNNSGGSSSSAGTTSLTGGAKLIQLCNALSIVISGDVSLRTWF